MEQLSELDKNRIINLEGVYNIRDLGGFTTKDGGTVKMGLLFRSDELGGLTERDLPQLASLGIKTIVDFRSKAEITRTKNKPPQQARTLELSINCGDSRAILDSIGENSGASVMEDVNRSLVRDNGELFREFFALIADRANLPLLFHCTAGKDRTGFAAAMFLSAVGVAREDIFRDYMLSANGVNKKFKAVLKVMPQLAPVIAVHPDYLLAAFREIETRFGSTENYLTRELGIDLDKMRGIFVE